MPAHRPAGQASRPGGPALLYKQSTGAGALYTLSCPLPGVPLPRFCSIETLPVYSRVPYYY